MQPEGWTGPFQVPQRPQKEAGPGLGQADPSSQAPPHGSPVSPGSGAHGQCVENRAARNLWAWSPATCQAHLGRDRETGVQAGDAQTGGDSRGPEHRGHSS